MSDSDGGNDAGDHDEPTIEVIYPINEETEVPETKAQLFKTVLVEGLHDGARPPIGAKVSVHYVGTLASDGSTFDSSRDRGEYFDFTIGQGQVIKGWDKGVATMRRGEKSILKCLPEYAYGKNGSPPKIPADATLNFEVELFDWSKTEDISENKDKSLMKDTVQIGSDYDHPDYESTVQCDVVSMQGGSTVQKNMGWTVVIGETALPSGLEKAICSMKKGEVAEVTLKSSQLTLHDASFGYDVAGENVVFSITVVSFDSVKTWSFKGMEKVTEGVRRKDDGNKFFVAKEFNSAHRKYKRALEFLENDYGLEGEAKEAAHKAKSAVLSNLAQTCINLNLLQEALTHCNKALESDAHNVKALFRRGKVFGLLDEWDDGKRDLLRILETDPTNVDAQRELKIITDKIAEYDRKQKARFSKMFA